MPEKAQRTILNVDDNESGRYVLSRILRKEGYEVVEAGTGARALEAARMCPDLILLDVQLPDINGLEVCRRIKQDPLTSSIPVLQISAAHIAPCDRTAGLEGGADAYLVQPVDPGLLVATVNALLRARRAEAEVLAAARVWENTFGAINDGVCVLDAGGRVLRANRAMAAMTGTPVERLSGRLYTELLPAAVAPSQGWPFEEVRETPERRSAEVRSDGQWYLISADPLLDERGQFQGAVQTVRNITLQKQSEAEKEQLVRQLAAERSRFEEVLRQMPAGVLIAEAPSGKLLLGNQQVERIWRRPFSASAGIEQYNTEWPLFHADGRPYEATEFPLARSILHAEVVSGEEMGIRRGDGTKGMISASSAPIFDQSGRVVAAVLTFQDTTERKALEEQFRQAQKMDAVGRLAGGVAHDFNNLLTIIGGYAHMIVDGLDAKDPVRKDMEAITEATERATALTRQLLTFSRRQMVEMKTLDLNRLINRMNRILRRVIGEDIELKTNLKPGSAKIKADAGQIEQVIMNLALNARDAMPKGGKLFIETESVLVTGATESPNLEPGNYIVLSVRDSGTGMTQEVQSHLFEPFFTTKGKGKGTGLGLSTVYGIVKQSKGEIVVESAPNQGTSFRIYLPEQGETTRMAPIRGGRHQDLRGDETVLLVEDESDVRTLARQMLTRLGYSVVEASGGEEALRIWRTSEESIDVVLTDIVMPGMSGRELVDELRRRRPGLKVVFMSGYTDDVIAKHGALDPGINFVHKPFTQDILSRKMREVLGFSAEQSDKTA